MRRCGKCVSEQTVEFMADQVLTMQGKFRSCESGAVTIDWVVLSATVILAFILAGQPIYTVMGGLVEEVAAEIDAISVDP